MYSDPLTKSTDGLPPINPSLFNPHLDNGADDSKKLKLDLSSLSQPSPLSTSSGMSSKSVSSQSKGKGIVQSIWETMGGKPTNNSPPTTELPRQRSQLLNFENLELVHYLSEASPSHPPPLSSIKKHSYQQIARDFLLKFLLEWEAELFKNKANLAKLHQFRPDFTPSTDSFLLFNYLHDLTLMSQVLQMLPQDLLDKKDVKEPIVLMVKKLVKKFKNLKDVQDSPQMMRIKICCCQIGDCLQQYVTILTHALRKQIQKEDEIKRVEKPKETFQLCHCLSPQLEVGLQNLLKNPCSSFNGDFNRIIQAQLLIVSNENTELPPPQLTVEIGKDKELLQTYNQSLLNFFMHYLQIHETDKSNVLSHFDKPSSISMADFYEALEQEEEECKENPELSKANRLKLLPFLRAMGQAVLCGTQFNLITLEKFITVFSSKNKILREISNKPENYTKQIHFYFKDDSLTLKLKRVCALEDLNNSSLNYFPACEINIFTTLTISLPDLDNHTTRIEIEISCPPYTPELGWNFLQRYAALITLIKTMGINYRVANQMSTSSPNTPS